MIVVSDTSPIRALAYLALLPILEELFGVVVIPPAVVEELHNPARPAPDEALTDLSVFPFIEVRSPTDETRVTELVRELDRGESEAIVLAEELQCPAILMDEAIGRQVAIRRGLTPLGTAGLLLRAKHAGFIDEVRTSLNRLTADLGFFLSDSLRHRILDEANE